MLEEQSNIFDFNMIDGKERHIRVPYKQMIVILEALKNLKKDIEEFETNSAITKIRFKNKLEEVEYLIQVIEDGTEYDFHKHLDKCINKKEKSDDAGIDALSASVVLKK